MVSYGAKICRFARENGGCAIPCITRSNAVIDQERDHDAYNRNAETIADAWHPLVHAIFEPVSCILAENSDVVLRPGHANSLKQRSLHHEA